MTSEKINTESAVVTDLSKMTSGDNIPWYKQTELRKLYFLMPFLFLGSTTLGYDGSVLNGLQTMDTWQSCNTNPSISLQKNIMTNIFRLQSPKRITSRYLWRHAGIWWSSSPPIRPVRCRWPWTKTWHSNWLSLHSLRCSPASLLSCLEF